MLNLLTSEIDECKTKGKDVNKLNQQISIGKQSFAALSKDKRVGLVNCSNLSYFPITGKI